MIQPPAVVLSHTTLNHIQIAMTTKIWTYLWT